MPPNGVINQRLIFNAIIVPPTVNSQLLLLEKKNILLGAQDCSSELCGAFTGDVSVNMLKDSECSIVIVGHSAPLGQSS